LNELYPAFQRVALLRFNEVFCTVSTNEVFQRAAKRRIAMTFSELKEYIQSDLYRFHGRADAREFVLALLKNRSFKITFWYRLAHALGRKPGVGILVRWKYSRVCGKYCVDLPWQTKIGKGAKLAHAYGLVVHGDAVIGDNVLLTHQVTLATEKGRAPVIGNCVRISPGAKIVGGVRIGDNVVVGANAVVIKGVPSNTVAVGVPARVLDRPFKEFAERYYWPPAGK
jgi:serine O-acetyltransferase